PAHPLPAARALGRRRRDGSSLRRARDLARARHERHGQGHARGAQHAGRRARGAARGAAHVPERVTHRPRSHLTSTLAVVPTLCSITVTPPCAISSFSSSRFWSRSFTLSRSVG